MTERTDNYRFYLTSDTALGTRLIEEPRDFDKDSLVYELQEQGRYFSKSREEQITFLESGRDYLLTALDIYGPDTEIRLIVKVKDDKPLEDGFAEGWKTISNVGIDLYTLNLDEEPDNQQVSVDLITGGVLKRVESRFKDEYDLTADTEVDDIGGIVTTDLDFKTICLDPRRIFRRSVFKPSPATKYFVSSFGGGNDEVVYPVPVVIEVQNSDSDFLSPPSFLQVRTVNNQYAAQDTSLPSVAFFLNTDRTRLLTVELSVEANITVVRKPFASIRFDLVKFGGGLAGNYVDRLELTPNSDIETGRISFSQTLTANAPDDFTSLREGESLAFTFWSEGTIGVDYDIEFINGTKLEINEDSDFPATTAKGIRVYEAFRKLSDIQGIKFNSSLFGPGGKYYDLFLMHGTWIRNVPIVINQGDNDERRVQSPLSFEDLWEAVNMLIPCRYDQIFEDGINKFYVGDELETQRDYISVSIRDAKGSLQEVSDKKRNVLSDNYYGLAEIGSNTSGENYEEVNNLFSPQGKAQWVTPNKNSDKVYERTSDFRTGSEDIELQRIQQYSEESDKDAARDNDWFFVDCKESQMPNCDYEPKKWQDFFEEEPTNVFDPPSAYNWIFRPSNLLFNHSWKIAPAVWYTNGTSRAFLEFASSNCNSSLTTKEPGLNRITEDQNISFGTTGDSRFQRPTVRLMAVEFRTVLTQDVVERLEGEKNGLIEYQFKGERRVGRLIKGTAQGTFTLIEAR